MAGLSDIGQVVVSIATAAGTAGGGVAWIWNKIEGRFAAMRAEHAEAIKKIEEEAEKCEDRETKSQIRHGILTIVIELLQQAVQRVDPAAPELARTQKLMDQYQAINVDGVLP